MFYLYVIILLIYLYSLLVYFMSIGGFFCVFVACWCCELNLHIYLQCGRFIFHSENTTINISSGVFFIISVISSYYNHLQVISISLWKTMYRMNTRNVNSKLSVFKAHWFNINFDSRGINWCFNYSENCWNNDIVCTVSIPKTDMNNYILCPWNSWKF